MKIDKTEPVVRVDFEGTFGRWSADGVQFSMSILNQAISGVRTITVPTAVNLGYKPRRVR